jgi:uncharacterized protein
MAAAGRIDVRVFPRSPRTTVDGLRDGKVIVRVTAAPADGAANALVLETVASALGVPKRDVRIVTGGASRNKTIEVDGLNAEAIRARLSSRPV